MSFISSIAIDNFRGLRDFQMEGARMFNLLVGPSEIGKTTVLESLDIMSFGHFLDVNLLNLMRGAQIENENDAIVAAASLFHNFRPVPISMAITRARDDTFEDMDIRVEIVPVKGDTVVSHSDMRGIQITNPFLAGFDQFDGLKLSVEMSGAVVAKGHKFIRPRRKDMQSGAYEMSQDIARADETSTPLSQEEIKNLRWDSYMVHHPMPKEGIDMATMNKKKNAIVEILMAIDPKIIDVATVSDTAYMDIDLEKMVSMHIAGNGIRQVLGTLGHLCSKDYNIYLEDEIGAGIYFGSQKIFLRAVLRFAKQEGKQIFATTHNKDVLVALKEVLAEEEYLRDDAAVFSFMRDKEGKVWADAYLYEDIDRCIANGIDIRGR